MACVLVAVNEIGKRIGESHHNARYSDTEIQHVHTLRQDGLSYGAIAIIMEIPKSTIASICRGERRCQIAVSHKIVVTEKAETTA